MAATVALYELTRMAREMTAIEGSQDDRPDRGTPTVERIAQIRSEAEQAIAAADDTHALEEVADPVPGAQGRAAEPAARPSPSSPPEQRAATGKAANEARQALEALIERDGRGARRAASSSERLERDRVDVTLPADPLPQIGRLHLITADPARDRGRVHRARVQRRRGARGRDRLLQLRRAQHAGRRTPRG